MVTDGEPHPAAPNLEGLGIRDTRHGLGVFVLRPVASGDRILTFHGAAVDFAAALAKGERECDALQIGVDAYLDLDPPGKFVNHSCEPNSGVRDGVHLVALKDLDPGDEVLFDYSTTMSENHWTLDCACGSRRCRKVVRDFRWLPRRRKLDLIRQGVVPGFILVEELESGRLRAAQLAAGTVSRARRVSVKGSRPVAAAPRRGQDLPSGAAPS